MAELSKQIENIQRVKQKEKRELKMEFDDMVSNTYSVLKNKAKGAFASKFSMRDLFHS